MADSKTVRFNDRIFIQNAKATRFHWFRWVCLHLISFKECFFQAFTKVNFDRSSTLKQTHPWQIWICLEIILVLPVLSHLLKRLKQTQPWKMWVCMVITLVVPVLRNLLKRLKQTQLRVAAWDFESVRTERKVRAQSSAKLACNFFRRRLNYWRRVSYFIRRIPIRRIRVQIKAS